MSDGLGRQDDVVAPTRDDGVLSGLSDGIGGPLGAHAGRHPWWTPVRVLLVLTAVTFAMGMWQKGNCYHDSWTDGNARYTHMCYSDLPYLYTGRGFAELEWPYTDNADVRARYQVMEYPVGIAYWAYGTAWVTHWLKGSPDVGPRGQQPVDALFGQELPEIRMFTTVNALGFAVVALLATWLLAAVNRKRPWDAAAFAASPALLLTGLVNWDMLAVVMVAGALWAWSKDRPVLTGVLIGLGTATKLYPLFLLGGLLIICVRDRRWRDLVLAVTAAATAWILIDLPAYLSSASDWNVFWSFNSKRGADLGSIWLIASQAWNTTFSPHTINFWSAVFLVLWCLGVLAVCLRARETPRLAQIGYLVVTGFLLVNKVYSPQYVLWLLPLAVIARPRWRDQIIWQATEVAYFCSVWWYLGGELAPGDGGDPTFYWLAVVLRMSGELYLVGMIVRDILRPEHDPVRRTESPPLPPRRHVPPPHAGRPPSPPRDPQPPRGRRPTLPPTIPPGVVAAPLPAGRPGPVVQPGQGRAS